MATLGDIRYAASVIGLDRGYVADASLFSNDAERSAVVLEHRCSRRMVITFTDRIMLAVGAESRIVNRLVACIDLGCICEVTVVTDRDPGDEDLD